MRYPTMIHWKSTLIFSIGLFVIACSKNDNPGLVGAGRILDAETMLPVDSAIVSMYAPSERGGGSGLAQQVYTDDDGWFQFNQGTENFYDNTLEISKPTYYIKSEKLKFRAAVSDFLLCPKSFLKFSPNIDNPEQKTWSVNLRMGQFENFTSYSAKSNNTLYIPLKGGISNKIEARFSVSYKTVDTIFYDFNIPFRDTLEVEFTRNI